MATYPQLLSGFPLKRSQVSGFPEYAISPCSCKDGLIVTATSSSNRYIFNFLSKSIGGGKQRQKQQDDIPHFLFSLCNYLNTIKLGF